MSASATSYRGLGWHARQKENASGRMAQFRQSGHKLARRTDRKRLFPRQQFYRLAARSVDLTPDIRTPARTRSFRKARCDQWRMIKNCFDLQHSATCFICRNLLRTRTNANIPASRQPSAILSLDDPPIPHCALMFLGQTEISGQLGACCRMPSASVI